MRWCRCPKKKQPDVGVQAGRRVGFSRATSTQKLDDDTAVVSIRMPCPAWLCFWNLQTGNWVTFDTLIYFIPTCHKRSDTAYAACCGLPLTAWCISQRLVSSRLVLPFRGVVPRLVPQRTPNYSTCKGSIHCRYLPRLSITTIINGSGRGNS